MTRHEEQHSGPSSAGLLLAVQQQQQQQQQPMQLQQQCNGCTSPRPGMDAYAGAEQAIDAEIELLMALKIASGQLMLKHSQPLLQRLTAALLSSTQEAGTGDDSPSRLGQDTAAQLARLQAQGLVSCALSPSQLQPQLHPSSVMLGTPADAELTATSARQLRQCSIDLGCLDHSFSSSQAPCSLLSPHTDDFLRPLSCDSSINELPALFGAPPHSNVDAVPTLFGTPPNSLAAPLFSCAGTAAAAAAVSTGVDAGFSTPFGTPPLQANLAAELELAALLSKLELQDSSCMLGTQSLQSSSALPSPPGLQGLPVSSSMLNPAMQCSSYSASSQRCSLDSSVPLLLPEASLLAAGAQVQGYCGLIGSSSTGLNWGLAMDPEYTEQALEAAQELLFPGVRSMPLPPSTAATAGGVAACAASAGTACDAGRQCRGRRFSSYAEHSTAQHAAAAGWHQQQLEGMAARAPAYPRAARGDDSRHRRFSVDLHRSPPTWPGMHCAAAGGSNAAGPAAATSSSYGGVATCSSVPPPPPPPPASRAASVAGSPELAASGSGLRFDGGSTSSSSSSSSTGGSSRAAAHAAAAAPAACTQGIPQAPRARKSLDVHRGSRSCSRGSLEHLSNAAPPKWVELANWDPRQDALKSGAASCKGTGVFMPRMQAASPPAASSPRKEGTSSP